MVRDDGTSGRSRAVPPKESALSGWEVLFKSQQPLKTQALTIVQLPLLQQNPAWWYQGNFFLLCARFTSSFPKHLYLGFVELFVRRIMNEKSDIVSRATVQAAAGVLIYVTERNEARWEKVL